MRPVQALQNRLALPRWPCGQRHQVVVVYIHPLAQLRHKFMDISRYLVIKSDTSEMSKVTLGGWLLFLNTECFCFTPSFLVGPVVGRICIKIVKSYGSLRSGAFEQFSYLISLHKNISKLHYGTFLFWRSRHCAPFTWPVLAQKAWQVLHWRVPLTPFFSFEFAAEFLSPFSFTTPPSFPTAAVLWSVLAKMPQFPQRFDSREPLMQRLDLYLWAATGHD